MEGIGDFLSDEQPSEVNETPATEPAPEAATAEPVTEGQPRDEHGRFAPKEPTGVAEPAAEPQVPVPPTEPTNQLPPHEYAALKDERRKRQEAEARAAAVEAHYAQLARQQQAQPQQPAVDFWDDPQAFMDSRMAQLGETMLQQWEQRQQAQRLDASEQAARAKYPDYSEAFSAFEQAVQTNPRLAFELAQQSDPGEFAYAKGKAALAIQSVGSLDELKAQIRAELEAEARAAFNPATPRPVLPSTTAGDTSVGARSGPAWGGPTAIGDILR